MSPTKPIIGHVNNRCLQQDVQGLIGKLGRFAWLAAGLPVILGNCGCTAHRPVPLLVRHAPASVAGKPGERLNFKLVTYNIWGLPSWINGARQERFRGIARELEDLDPDIILLQEAWTAKSRLAVPSSWRWSMARASGQHTFFHQNGLVTLSKFPIIDGEFHPFSRAAFPDCLVRKGALKVTLQLPDGQIVNVWNVHLQQGGAPEIRRSQIHELVAAVQAADDGQLADVIGGDFNCTPGSILFHELETALGPTVHQICGTKPFITWRAAKAKRAREETLDHIFVRPSRTLQETRAFARLVFAPPDHRERLSDHLGIEATLELVPTTTRARGTTELAFAQGSNAP